VDVRPAKKVKDIRAYTAAIVGRAVRIGKLLGDATKFVKKNRDALQEMTVAYLVLCITMKDDSEENRGIVEGYLDPVREMVQTVHIGLFADAMDCDKLGFP
jgi:menaquinone-dependent protoporphyrinogen IX oxidase